MRREGDSNPRYAFDVYTLSRRASSATRASLLLLSYRKADAKVRIIIGICKFFLYFFSLTGSGLSGSFAGFVVWLSCRVEKISINKNKQIYFSMFFPYFYLLMFYQCGTVFQTAFLTTCYNPETSSRVTLASLGIGFQPNLAGYWSSLNKTSI